MTDRASSAGPDNERDTGATTATEVREDAAPVVTETKGADQPAQAATDAAQSPGADPQDAKKAEPSMRDVVKAALAPKAAPADTSTAASEGNAPSDPKAADANKDAKAAEGKDGEVPPEFHKHPAWQRIIGARDDALAENAKLKPDSENYQNITGFMKEFGLSPEMVGEGFTAMAQMRSGTPDDMRKALVTLDRYRDNLMLALGDKLPEDLQAKVDRGLIDDESAKEVAKNRLASATATVRATTAESSADAAKKASDAAEQTRAEGAMQGAVTKWETDQASRDPDYSRKRLLVRDRARIIMQEDYAANGKVPRTPEDAVAVAKRAHDQLAVEQGWNATQRRPTTTTRTPTGRPASTATPEAPTTLKGAIQGALASR